MPDCEKDFENLTQNYTIDTPNIHNTLEIVDTMRENNLFPADTISIGDWNQQFALYNEGKAAMIYAWTWQIPNITEETAENSVIIDALLCLAVQEIPQTSHVQAVIWDI